jgi:putative transposase
MYMSTYISTSELAKALNLHPNSVAEAVKKGRWRGKELVVRVVEGVLGRGGKRYEVLISSLPDEYLNKISKTSEPEPEPEPENKPKTKSDPKTKPKSKKMYSKESLWTAWEVQSTQAKEKAQSRLETLLKIESLIGEGFGKGEAIDEIAGSGKRATVFRWYAQVEDVDREDWLPALLPSYSAQSNNRVEYSEELYQAYKSYYLSPLKRTSKHCFTLAVEEIKHYVDNPIIPHEITLRRRLFKEIDPQVLDYAREGKRSLTFQNPVPPQKRDKRMMHALQTINGDGYDHKFYVIFPDGEEAHPTTWFWQDVYSGMILGWYTDKSENSDMLRLALRDVIEKWGLGVDAQPFTVIVDNTRAASAKVMTGRMKQRHRYPLREDEIIGLYERLGTPYQPTLPYSGQSKPIERRFGIGGISEYVDKHPLTEKARNKGSGVTWEQFQALLNESVEMLNNKISTSVVCNGMLSPADVFHRSLNEHIPIRATKQQLNMLLMCAKGVPIAQHGGITFMGNGYYDPALNAHAGKKVMIEYDPYRLRGGINVYTLDGKFIAHAPCTQSVGFHDTETAKETMRIKRARQKVIKEAAKVEQREGALRRRQKFQDEKTESPKPIPAPTPKPTPKVVGVDFQNKPTAGGDIESASEREQKFIERMRALEAKKRSA